MATVDSLADGRQPLHWQSELLPLAQRYGERTAVVDRAGAITYADLFARAAGLAEILAKRGVAPCTPVATWLANGRAAVWASLGVTLAGAAEVRLNASLAADDIAHSVHTAGIALAITSADRADVLRRLDVPVITPEEVGTADLAALDLPSAPADGWSRIGFTSGTTGKPKGIVHSQEGRWIANQLLRASLPRAPGEGDNILLMTPFSHGAALMTYAFLEGGAAVTLLPGVDTTEVIGLLERRAVTQMFAPPTVLAKIVAALAGRQMPGLDCIYTGTAPLTGALYRQARAIFGPVVRVTYGMSELWNPITVLASAETDAVYGGDGEPGSACVGWPGAGVAVEVADAGEDGAASEPGPRSDIGRVRLCARHLFIGHLQDGVFLPRPPGPYDTGDLGRIDERGRLHLIGRVADVMKSGGYRIAPEEVEAALRVAAMPAEIVVFSLPSDYWGEIVTLAFCGSDRPDPSTFDRALAAMTAYKRPRLTVELAEVPRNAIGKIQRRIARAQVLERYRLEDGPRPRLVAKVPAA